MRPTIAGVSSGRAWAWLPIVSRIRSLRVRIAQPALEAQS
jgi:hypothetical protein